ncbi:hypothetical protein HY643_02525 [Candidatus Woesearchaeota archaeon]|nr:hypothetical protein [Candidatus Woesearchaeota archaeon]
MEDNITNPESEQQVELRKMFQALLNKEGSPVVKLSDVSKWEKISPKTLVVAQSLDLDFKKKYKCLLQNEIGLYTLILGKYYQRKAKEQELKDVALSIEALLQKQGTTMDQLEVYAINTFKELPDKKELLKDIAKARKDVEKFKKATNLEEKLELEKETIKIGILWDTTKGITKKLAIKTTYPILGSLPYPIQEKIEEKFGKENYNASSAIASSVYTILGIGGIIGGSISYNDTLPYASSTNLFDRCFLATLGAIIGVGVAFMSEIVVRECIAINRSHKGHFCSGTPILELAYLPFTGANYLYKKMKEGIKKSYEEAKSIEDTIKRYKSIPPGRK